VVGVIAVFDILSYSRSSFVAADQHSTMAYLTDRKYGSFGGYLLRDFLRRNQKVAVLVRPRALRPRAAHRTSPTLLGGAVEAFLCLARCACRRDYGAAVGS